MGRGLIPGTIWKISCHNLFITYLTLNFFKHWLLSCSRDHRRRGHGFRFLLPLFSTTRLFSKLSCPMRLWKRSLNPSNCENNSLREFPLFNLQILLFRVWFTKGYQTMSICKMTLESVCKIYPRRWHLNVNSYSTRRIHLS
jgi:hypothetical protein